MSIEEGTTGMRSEPVLEQHRTAAIVLGAERLTPWRPTDERLRAVVDVVKKVHTHASAPDVGLVLDQLRAAEPHWPWPSFISELIARWDLRLDALAARRNVVKLGRLVEQAYAALDQRVDALLEARREAERALAIAHRAYELFECEARVLGVSAPHESSVRLSTSQRAAPANDNRPRRAA